MHLRQIKLAGFKSFIDPTPIDVPGNLVGVVGPNGCGKSNVIDAVRWVLGESKAAELRGESMQDVIFNGSVNRKPAGRASVELVFDNNDGRIGGAWGSTARSPSSVLTRDGTSSYYINNQNVRRRDVHDMFLGTGLGPRAYAIIGQGMISRIVEARPEELRIFLEEAAGISKYKERRRETENRLGDTRDNLTRVEDILRDSTARSSGSSSRPKLRRGIETCSRSTTSSSKCCGCCDGARPTPSVTRSSGTSRRGRPRLKAIWRNCVRPSASSRMFAPRTTAPAMLYTRRRAGCCRSTPK